MKRVIYVSLVCLVLSCNSKVPYGILKQDKMELLLWEQMKADVFTKDYLALKTGSDIAIENTKIQQQIFAKYGVDKKKFYKSYQYYVQHDELLKPLIDSIVAKQTRKRDEQNLKKYQSLQPINWQAPFKYNTVKVLPAYKLNKIFIVNDTTANIKIDDVRTMLPKFKKRLKKKSLQFEEVINSVE